MTDVRDHWAAGSSYENFMGRWSRLLAAEYVRWIDSPVGLRWLDVGCGTGSLARAICEIADPVTVVACDPAEPFVEFASTEPHDPRITYQVSGTGGLPRSDIGYDAVVSLLALNFFPDPLEGLQEMKSLANDGAIVSACVWDYADGMEFLRIFWDAAVSLDPSAMEFDEGRRFPICSRERLEDLFRGAGLAEVICEPVEITTKFSSFNDYWQPLLGGTGPAPRYFTSLEAAGRERLRESIRKDLCTGDNDTIELKAVSWAVRGRTE